MVQVHSEPKYPVVDENPSMGKIFRAFRTTDWRNLAVVTIATLPFGYAAGRPILMRQTMYASATISAMFGLMLGWQHSFARLGGFDENSIEVEKFGVHSSAPMATADTNLPIPETSDATAASSANE